MDVDRPSATTSHDTAVAVAGHTALRSTLTAVGLVLAFGVGWLVGGRAGREGLDEIVDAVKDIATSEELRGLVGALRSHASHLLKQVGTRLTDNDDPLTLDEVVDRVRQLIAEGIELTSSGS